MPLIKAAVKHLRKSSKRRKINNIMKNRVKSSIKDMLKLAKQKHADEFNKRLPEVMSLIDKAAKNHIFHKNNAGRKKSLLARASRVLAA